MTCWRATLPSPQIYFMRLPKARRCTSTGCVPAAIDQPNDTDQLYARILELGDDPLPYGIAPNRRVLEELIGHAMTQGILTRTVDIESLFAPSTLSLQA